MRIELETKQGDLIPIDVHKAEKRYYVIIGSGLFEATGDVPFLKRLDFITCSSQIQDFERLISNQVGYVDWNNDNEINGI
jgi:hypothetical protein